MLDRVARLPAWLILLLVAIVARSVTFGNPVVHVDEEFYFVTARSMLEGALPYVDVWDRKPIGLFLLYTPAAALGMPLGIWGYQAIALAAVVGTALLVVRLCERAGWSRGALPAAIAYILWLNFLDGQGGQAPVFYNLLMTAAAAMLAPRPGDRANPARRFRLGLSALALVGLSLQIKYSVVFEGLFFGLWWMWREFKLGRGVPAILVRATALAAAAALPTLAAWGYYAAIGHGADWVYANFTSIGERRPDPLLEQLGNLAKIVLIASPLFALAAMAWRQRGQGRERAVQSWLFAWAGAALAGLLAFGSWFEHYALPVIAPLACCAAGFLSQHHHRRRAATLLLAWGLVGGIGTLLVKRQIRGDAAQFTAAAATVGKGPGCLYVYSGTSMLYAASERCRLSRYVFPSHLGRQREQGAIGVDQQAEIERILALDPAVVVIRKPYIGERQDLRALVMRRMDAAYRLQATVPMGNDRLSVYRRK
ncbi:hypothetical protein [Sphingomonas sp.]|uniref:hypothetical protein n=1 Tax=Sphingomonas sp. TaxID=28214 RepID=UPI001B28D820|nr:hypothetical protein [Sphingomonas sp.]MBO9713022.1 hypothetical protein [Sphingomonas sp.]